MKKATYNFILALLTGCTVFVVGLSSVSACNKVHDQNLCVQKKIVFGAELQPLDFWGKFRDTVMHDENDNQNKKNDDDSEKNKTHNANDKTK